MSDIIKETVELKEVHILTWRKKNNFYWICGLLEEVIELILSLLKLHIGPPRWELTQITAICMNFAEKLEEENERV
jgi:hypothetical protein